MNTYWCHYGLCSDPFAGSDHKKEIYLPASWEQYFDLLHHFCRSSNVLLAVTGIPGSGKTTFSQEFVQQFSSEADVVQITHTTITNSAQLAMMLAKEFLLPFSASDSLEEQLDKIIINLQYKPRPCLLIIDNAHLLTPETLGALFYLIKQQSEDQMRLHILLVGELVLKEQLAALSKEEAEQLLLYHLSLAPFDVEQTSGYLKHRLVVAGLPAASPFTRQDIIRIHELAAGIPLRINTVARQILNGKIQKQPHFRPFYWLVASVLLLIITAIVFRSSQQQPIKVTPPPLPPPARVVQPQSPSPAVATVPAAVIDKAQQVITHVTEKEPVAKKESVGNYTVQLMIGDNTAALEKFIADHADDANDNYFYHYDAKNNRYLLLYGQYATFAEAHAAAKALPPELQSLQPWARKIP